MPCCFQGQSEEGCISEECGLLLLMEEIVHQLIGSLSYCLRVFLHPKWCKIFSINSIIFFFWGGAQCPMGASNSVFEHRHVMLCEAVDVETLFLFHWML